MRTNHAVPADRAADRDGGWAVEAHGLTKRFGTRAAVDHVDLLVPRGCAFGYLGPNGAGKTTLIRVLLGLTRADSGTMALLGIPVPGQRRDALARVGAIVDEPRFHGHLTGRENLKMLAAARGGDAGRQIGPALDRTRLTQRTVPVILLIVLEIIITPVLADHALPYFLNGERLVVGVAIDQLKPVALAGGTQVGPGGGGLLHLPPMPTWAMITVIAGWIIGWSAIGAWKMATRDA